MRLIDADALLEELKKTYHYFDLKFLIEDAPTIEPSANIPKYNLELIRDIVRELGHLDNYIADTYLRPNNKIHIQFENIFSDDCYFIEDDKYILAELEKIATNTEDCVEFTLTNNKKVIIHSADRIKGEWEHWGSPFSDESEVIDTIVCSVCGARFIEPKDEPKGEYNYCPSCGADMRGEK